MPDQSLSNDVESADARVRGNVRRFEDAVDRLGEQIQYRADRVRRVQKAARTVGTAVAVVKRGQKVVRMVSNARLKAAEYRERRRPPTRQERFARMVDRVRANPLPLLALAVGGLYLFWLARRRRARARSEMIAPVLLPEPVVIEREEIPRAA